MTRTGRCVAAAGAVACGLAAIGLVSLAAYGCFREARRGGRGSAV